jgi:23S rRNA (cytidine1920-2'-O)/16S rRNA (cytidine1409-2'-O)-methyltransferase
VDVDVRQIDARLRDDPRIVLVEKNARYLEPTDLPGFGNAGRAGGASSAGAGLIVMDVSFISILTILPALRSICRPPGEVPATAVLTLIKPQFEARKGQVGKKGVVRDKATHAEVLGRVIADAASLGFALGGLLRCATRGRTGNQEFFARLTSGGLHPPAEAVVEWVQSVTRET